MTTERTVFVTLVTSEEEQRKARLMLDSIRSFGGSTASSRMLWFRTAVTETDPTKEADTEFIDLEIPEALRSYYFGAKVAACAQAEVMAGDGADSLVWIDPGCLVISPPELFRLADREIAALRPVHIRNVGLDEEQEPDGFWRGIFDALGIEGITSTVETFVEARRIRSYFNTHAFSVKPASGLMGQWLHFFEGLVENRQYQQAHCRDPLHRIFLHQAVFSALIAGLRSGEGVRLLPPSYCYPYNLQDKVPEDRRASRLNDLVTIAYENRSLDPELVDDIAIDDPLRSWLKGHT